ncbi:NADP-dependent oxidoreductase domain-containing protein [Mycena rebaudengoi]|nr:NADP-dependent oxidoreductase domain-containing protein [Mycena rebaudengoi]
MPALPKYLAPAEGSRLPLARYRLLSPRASTRVSPIGLGAMSIGSAWGTEGMGEMNRESRNFIDTANNYQDGTSEQLLGEWMENRGNRDQMIIATKYSSPFKKWDASVAQKVNFVGNGSKSMRLSVVTSLKNLRTDYIDIFYVHWWDWDTSIEEVMNGLHSLVTAGKVLYLDTPAWVVSKANQWARDHGKTQFSIYQGQWNIMKRSFERDIIPIARDEGMALAPWDVLGTGRLRTATRRTRRRRTSFTHDGNWERTEDEVKMSRALEKVANEVAAKTIQAVAIAYVMHKTPYVFPMIGGRSVENMLNNTEAVEITLSSILPFDLGFPSWMIGDGTKEHRILRSTAVLDRWPSPGVYKAVCGVNWSAIRVL